MVSTSVSDNRSIGKAATLLRALLEDESVRGLRLVDLVQRCGLEKSTVHRVLAALMAEGLVDHDAESERYRLGIKFVEFGMAVLRRLDVRTEALPVLARLVAAAEETVHLGTRAGVEVIYLEKVEGPHAIQMRSRVGERMPLHSTGIGKAMLAYLSEEEVAGVIRQGLSARTEHTITTPEALRTDLQRIRTRGYSTDLEENEVGVRCVGAPVFDHNIRVVGAISIAGPAYRVSEERLHELAQLVTEAAQETSRRLGCVASPYAGVR